MLAYHIIRAPAEYRSRDLPVPRRALYHSATDLATHKIKMSFCPNRILKLALCPRVQSKIEKVPRDIKGEKLRKDTESLQIKKNQEAQKGHITCA